jgi:predicted amidohydrolase
MKIAAAQLAPEFKGVDANAETAVDLIFRLSQERVDLVVFPEAYLTGYCFSSREEAEAIALEDGAASLQSISKACAEYNVHAIVGYAEKLDDKLYNSAGVFTPNGVFGKYRKSHIPFLGLDRFVEAGTDLPIFDISGAKVGIGICYDVRIPELSRCYALGGADILCIPTNWPQSAEGSSDLVCPTRAMENHVFVVACDRVGEENGYRFIGRSKIIDPLGRIVASADHDKEAVLIAEIDPILARDKNVVKQAGEYELPLFESRNPELYGAIVEKKRSAP